MRLYIKINLLLLKILANLCDEPKLHTDKDRTACAVY
jgi:hypothetical protein